MKLRHLKHPGFMGLDTVELVMTVEEEFQIEISDTAAAKMRTPGDIQDYVVRTLSEQGKTVDVDLTWLRIQKIIVDQLGVKPERVTKPTLIIEELGAD